MCNIRAEEVWKEREVERQKKRVWEGSIGKRCNRGARKGGKGECRRIRGGKKGTLKKGKRKEGRERKKEKEREKREGKEKGKRGGEN